MDNRIRFLKPHALAAVIKPDMCFCPEFLRSYSHRAVVRDESKKKAGGTDHSNRRRERLPCDCDKRQAEAAAAAWPRADLQLMSPCSPQEGLIATHLLQHQDQELEHHDGKVAAGR